MEIDANTKFELIAETVFKQKIATMLLKLNKNMGNAHTGDEIAYVSTEIWKPIYFRNKGVPFGSLYKYYDDVIMGTIPVKKITVQSILSSLQSSLDKFKELDRVNKAKLINKTEVKQRNSSYHSVTSPIVLAASWMITKRCDGIDVDHLSTRQVSEYIAAGKDPDKLLKSAR